MIIIDDPGILRPQPYVVCGILKHAGYIWIHIAQVEPDSRFRIQAEDTLPHCGKPEPAGEVLKDVIDVTVDQIFCYPVKPVC